MDDLNSCRCKGCLKGIVEDLEAELARVRDRLGDARLRLELADAGFALAHREPAQEGSGKAHFGSQSATKKGSLRLTDAEREAVAAARDYMTAMGCRNTVAQRTIAAFLERIG